MKSTTRSRFVLIALIALAVPLGMSAQHSPAPDRPAEGAQKTAAPPSGPGPAPGIHPPAPMDGDVFAPGPPPTPGATPGEILPVMTPLPTPRITPGRTPRPLRPAPIGTPSRSTTPGPTAPRVATPRPTPAPPAPGTTPMVHE